jgi:hypothetical protein
MHGFVLAQQAKVAEVVGKKTAAGFMSRILGQRRRQLVRKAGQIAVDEHSTMHVLQMICKNDNRAM